MVMRGPETISKRKGPNPSQPTKKSTGDGRTISNDEGGKKELRRAFLGSQSTNSIWAFRVIKSEKEYQGTRGAERRRTRRGDGIRHVSQGSRVLDGDGASKAKRAYSAYFIYGLRPIFPAPVLTA